MHRHRLPWPVSLRDLGWLILQYVISRQKAEGIQAKFDSGRTCLIDAFVKEERILNSIPRVDQAHYLSAAQTMKSRFQDGTRERVFEVLEEWEQEQVARRSTKERLPDVSEGRTASKVRARPVCVLVGHAGTGKSAIASEFAERLEQHGRLGASFFFNRGVKDLNSPSKVSATNAMQLLRSQSALRIPVVEAARGHVSSVTLQQLENEYEDLLSKPLATLHPDHPPIFVVVDALDECTEDGPQLVPHLLLLLLSCAARPDSPLRLSLTSRPEPHYVH